MTKIVALSGSLRKESYNTKLLHYSCSKLNGLCAYEIVSIKNIPLYNADDEATTGIPEPVTKLKNIMAASDAFLIAAPEYNNSIPGVLKNAIDWLTRPPNDIAKVFYGKYIGVIGATPGGFGTINSQTAFLPIIRYLKLKPFYQRSLYLSNAHELFDDNDKIIDAEIAENVAEYARLFVEYIKSNS